MFLEKCENWNVSKLIKVYNSNVIGEFVNYTEDFLDR